MNRLQEFEIKVDRLQGLMKERSLSAVLLTKRSNFSWLTGGGLNHVATSSEMGVCSLLVRGKEVFLIANNIECQRVMQEELEGLPIQPVDYLWHEEATALPAAMDELLKGSVYGSDSGSTGEDINSALTMLRHPLTELEMDRYREVGIAAESAVREVCDQLSPGMSELEARTLLSDACYRRNLDPMVILIAFDQRIELYRHPIPTANKLSQRAMLVLGARRYGLMISITRIVQFQPLDQEMDQKHQAASEAGAVLNLASAIPGITLGEVLQQGIEVYEKHGFGNEWHLHHQGGLTGYDPRDVKATPGCSVKLNLPTAVAWNPSITGTKSEDTFLITANGIENLTVSAPWPYREIETSLGTLPRPDILVRD